MERDAKRKAGAAAIGEDDGRTPKRQKLPPSNAPNESLLEAGLRFIQVLKHAKDKTGRPIATDFIDLPDQDEYPDYYEQITLPVSIQTIEDKLRAEEYPDLATLESDFKRLVNNAKTYNERGSPIFEDAERLRKTASNWMTKFNPAYRDSNYVAQPTPIPEHGTNGVGNGDRARRAVGTPTQAPKSKSSNGRDLSDSDKVDGSGFEGLSFQQAQDKIITDLMDYKDDESTLKIFQPFVFLPPRSLKDYYELIRHPVSLDALRKKVRGIHGKASNTVGTGITELKSWQAFDEEVSFIWKNCREYNEDGSDMYNLADEFEEVFKSKLAEAKSKVDPPQQTLKINMGSKPPPIKLRLGGAARDSPVPSLPSTPGQRNSSTPGVIVDTSALQRQQQHVQAGMNGNQTPGGNQSSGNSFAANRTGSIPPGGTSYSRSASAASPPLASNGVKTEAQPGYSPAPNSVRPTSSTPGYAGQTPFSGHSMAPPTNAARVMSGSPHPYAQPHGAQNNHVQHHQYVPPNGFEKKYRAPGKTAADALLPNITLTSHPSLTIVKPYKLNVPASTTRTQQSLTITLPATHKTLQVVPTIPATVTSRPYRLIVAVNGQKASPLPIPLGLSGSDDGAIKKPKFDVGLKPGEVNQIDVEVLAAGKGEGKDKVEWEKCTVFVHLMR